jgi:hypothetical protein
MKSPLFHLIAWLLICSAAIGGYAYWYSFVTNQSTLVSDLENRIRTKTETSIKVAAARAALAEIAADESVVQGYFIPEDGVVTLIDDLQKRARAQSAQMKVLSVSTDGSAAQSTLVLLLSINVTGTFDAVMRTVGSLEYAPYDLSVVKLSLGKDDKSSWHADLQITIGSVAAQSAATTTAVKNIPSFL